jgi:hypothetical protein
LEQEVFSPVFFELTAAVVCQPSSVGFNMADVEVMTDGEEEEDDDEDEEEEEEDRDEGENV